MLFGLWYDIRVISLIFLWEEYGPMKYCFRCKKEFDTGKNTCPVCGEELKETEENEEDVSEIVATMTTLGIL